MFVRPRNSSRHASSHESDGERKSHRKHRERGNSKDYSEDQEPTRRYNSESANPMSQIKVPAIGCGGTLDCLVEEEARDIVVKPEDLQATFENLMCVIKEKGQVAFSGDTVHNMLGSLYEWMVFDENSQIIIPSEPGSTTVQKMWPQGSRIDTRKKKDRSAVESSSRRLKEVDGEYASTVASSVISSTMEEDGMVIRKGSIMYAERTHHTPSGHVQPAQYQHQGYSNPIVTRPVQYLNHDHDPFHSAHMMPAPQTFAPVPQTSMNNPRYSIVGTAVERPQRVQETPQPEPVQPVRRKVRRPRVGASARPINGEDDGTDVQFAD